MAENTTTTHTPAPLADLGDLQSSVQFQTMAFYYYTHSL